jgi:Protein of unknown function (DUF4230)
MEEGSRERPRSVDPRRRRALRTGATALVALLAILFVLAAVLQVRSFVQGLGNAATGQRTVDRSGPVLLQSIRDLSRYEAAAGTFQVIVDLEKDAGFLPTAVIGQRTLFVAIGTVNAYVDFSRLGDDAIAVSADRRSVTVRLPHAALDKPNLDHQRSYVYAEERGIVDRVRAFFDQAPNEQAELYQVAERKIGEAATQSQLADRAETNARTMLQEMLRALGYQQVAVTYG